MRLDGYHNCVSIHLQYRVPQSTSTTTHDCLGWNRLYLGNGFPAKCLVFDAHDMNPWIPPNQQSQLNNPFTLQDRFQPTYRTWSFELKYRCKSCRCRKSCKRKCSADLSWGFLDFHITHCKCWFIKHNNLTTSPNNTTTSIKYLTYANKW